MEFVESEEGDTKSNFIDWIEIKQENKIYKIEFGYDENNLNIKVIPEISKNLFYYQKSFIKGELNALSKTFTSYTPKEIIDYLKNLKIELEEKNDKIVLKIHIFSLDGQNELIEFKLEKCFLNKNNLINNLIDEIISIKNNMKNLEEISKNEKEKHESEIIELKKDIEKYQNEISNLKESIENYKKENSTLLDEIKKLKTNQEMIKTNLFFDSKIESIGSIDFIFDFIRQNDINFNFNSIKLLYRGSRDGDKTKTCHELCDNKQNVLIIMQSDSGFIFGGYSKIGFQTVTEISSIEYKIDNDSFLFSVNLKKIYPVIKDKKAICYARDKNGLCFYNSLVFYDNFMNESKTIISDRIQKHFNGFENNYEMNGGQDKFKFTEIEVFQLL